MALGDPGRAEDRDPLLDVAQGVEGGVDLGHGFGQAALVVCLEVDRDAQQVLVVPGAVGVASLHRRK